MSEYNFVQELACVVKGRALTGYADEGIMWGKQNEDMEMNVGAQGEVLTNIHHNPIGFIDITLKSNSSSITFLNRIANSKQAVPIRAIRRGAITEEAGGTRAWCTKVPDTRRGRNAENVTYRFLVEDYEQR